MKVKDLQNASNPNTILQFFQKNKDEAYTVKEILETTKLNIAMITKTLYSLWQKGKLARKKLGAIYFYYFNDTQVTHK